MLLFFKKLFLLETLTKITPVCKENLCKHSLVSQFVWDKKNSCSSFTCHLSCKLSEIIVENVSVTFRVTTEWLLIFFIFTLTITILACFTRKKSKIVQGICTHAFTKASPSTPWEVYSFLQMPPFNCFWLCQELMHPYFFCSIPWSLSCR